MDVVGSIKIVLRSGTGKYPVKFFFAAASSPAINDGSLPYGTTIASVQALITDSAGVDITSQAIDSVAVDVSGLQVDLSLNFPATAAKFKAVTMLILTLSSGSIIVKRWDGISIE